VAFIFSQKVITLNHRGHAPSVIMSYPYFHSLSSQKTVTYSLYASRRLPESARSAHRQFTTIMMQHPARLCPRHASSLAPFRRVNARGLSYASIPRIVARAFRVLIAGATASPPSFNHRSRNCRDSTSCSRAPPACQLPTSTSLDQMYHHPSICQYQSQMHW
jgi:hypothetical protein